MILVFLKKAEQEDGEADGVSRRPSIDRIIIDMDVVRFSIYIFISYKLKIQLLNRIPKAKRTAAISIKQDVRKRVYLYKQERITSSRSLSRKRLSISDACSCFSNILANSVRSPEKFPPRGVKNSSINLV